MSGPERDELVEFLAVVHWVEPNFNDTFAYACADTESISVGDGKLMAELWRSYGWHGLVAIAALKRGREPLREVAENPKYKLARAALLHPQPVDDEGWTLLEEFDLDRGVTRPVFPDPPLPQERPDGV